MYHLPAHLRPLSADERAGLEKWSRCLRRPRTALRASIVLLSRDPGGSHATIAARLQTSRRTVRTWIERFESGGIAALLFDRPGHGRKSRLEALRERSLAELADWLKMYRDVPERTHPRLSQRQLARLAQVPLASLNRLLQREGRHLTYGYVRRRRFAYDPLLVGLFLDPPLKVIAVWPPAQIADKPGVEGPVSPEEAPARERRQIPEASRLLLASRTLVETLDALEFRLLTCWKKSGRLEALGRFLRSLANVDTWADHRPTIQLYCAGPGDAETSLLERYRALLPVHSHQGGRLDEWLAGVFAGYACDLGSRAAVGRELDRFGNKINSRVRQREAKGKLQRPFHVLIRRELFGRDRYQGDRPLRDECLDEDHILRIYSPPDPPPEPLDIAF